MRKILRFFASNQHENVESRLASRKSFIPDRHRPDSPTGLIIFMHGGAERERAAAVASRHLRDTKELVSGWDATRTARAGLSCIACDCTLRKFARLRHKGCHDRQGGETGRPPLRRLTPGRQCVCDGSFCLGQDTPGNPAGAPGDCFRRRGQTVPARGFPAHGGVRSGRSRVSRTRTTGQSA